MADNGEHVHVDGRFVGLDARMQSLERATAGVKTTIIGTGIAVVAVMIAVLAYGQTWFGIGVTTRDIVRATITEYIQQHPDVGSAGT